MKTVNILYQCDNNFAFMVGVSMTSLLINASKNVQYNIFLLTPDMSADNREKFMHMKELFPDIHYNFTFLDAAYCENEIKSWNVPDHRGSYVTYYKLLLDHYFKDTDVEQIIHIGADTLILGTLEELADFDFKGNPIAMNWSEKLYERHFPYSYKYCIAEMVYFNLPEWRRHHCEERVKKHFMEIGDIYGSKDQGILNMEFQNERTQLPLKFNIYGITYYFNIKNKSRFNNARGITRKEIEQAYKQAEIVHIPRTFLYRPHESGSQEPLKNVWCEYCKKSPWKDIKVVSPFPALGSKEKFLRLIYLCLPKYWAEWFYIACRHGYGFMHALLWRPLPGNRRQIGLSLKRRRDIRDD